MKIPRELSYARNALCYRSDFQVVGDWERLTENWALQVKINIGGVPPESLVPSVTAWHFVVDDAYPLGSIAVFPSMDGGISHTFQHQFRNKAQPSRPYRTGNICTGNRFHVSVSSGESYDPSHRLYNYVEWTRKWAIAAANGRFAAEGELFELPDFGVASQGTTLIHSENPQLLEDWKGIQDNSGLAVIAPASFNSNILVITEFQDKREQTQIKMPWREGLASSEVQQLAVWLRVPSPPLLPPFATPITWGEMEEALTLIDQQLARRLNHARQLARRRNANLLLIGYAIPNRYGEPEQVMDWQPIKLPPFGDSRTKPKGFRNNPESLARFDNTRNFYPSAQISYRKAENWSPDATQSRGRLPSEVTELKTLLVGAGSLGSLVAEALVRGGLRRLHILDRDSFAVGNLVRHTLLSTDIEQGKSARLAERLQRSNIHSSVSSSSSELQKDSIIEGYDAIVDTTGNAEVIEVLHDLSVNHPIHFFTFSMSLGAKHLYAHHQFGQHFDPELYSSTIGELARRNYEDFPEDEIPQEHVGCWHPVFPARMGQVMLLASLVAPELGRQIAITSAGEYTSSCVFEVLEDDFGATGIKRVEL